MKAVEVTVRDASGLPDDPVGVKLMREAFRDNEQLADMTSEADERVGRIEFFASAIGCYKNRIRTATLILMIQLKPTLLGHNEGLR